VPNSVQGANREWKGVVVVIVGVVVGVEAIVSVNSSPSNSLPQGPHTSPTAWKHTPK